MFCKPQARLFVQHIFCITTPLSMSNNATKRRSHLQGTSPCDFRVANPDVSSWEQPRYKQLHGRRWHAGRDRLIGRRWACWGGSWSIIKQNMTNYLWLQHLCAAVTVFVDDTHGDMFVMTRRCDTTKRGVNKPWAKYNAFKGPLSASSPARMLDLSELVRLQQVFHVLCWWVTYCSEARCWHHYISLTAVALHIKITNTSWLICQPLSTAT